MNAASNFATAAWALRWPIVATVLLAGLAIWTARKVNAWADAEIAATVEAALMCEDYDWLFESPEFIETPIYDATIAHVAAQAAVDLDGEWARISGGGWSS